MPTPTSTDMPPFEAYLKARLAATGFTAEDALVAILPLVRQTLAAHEAGYAAPLEGLAALRVAGAEIWFEAASRLPLQKAAARLLELDPLPTGALDIVAEQKQCTDVGTGQEQVANLSLGSREAPLTRPVYLPGYVCWEQLVGHRDPVGDTFCLGMLLASLLCGLDFNDPAQLKRFVENRGNLFRLQPQLHPVLAKAIVRMTELSRHRRPQELRAVLRTLEHYRDQEVDLDFDVASRTGALPGQPARDRRQIILARLQERLFEISRRNRLLHFRPTLNTLNLTHASVPLAFDVQRIRAEQILTWSGSFKSAVCEGREIPLNSHLNFAEVLYLPGQLDHIRLEAQRDQAEFGFEPLRLVLCFLRWADVKAKPAEAYTSPLVLLPVRLQKRKGVRDAFILQPLQEEAEVNPVVRHLFKQLYDIRLPETLELTPDALDAFHTQLAALVQASEPGITVAKIDRPRIDLIHDQARRRLDSYRRQARLSGRNVRSYLDVDYSYDPDNFQPLGLRLFAARIRRPALHLREILQASPAPRHFFGPEEAAPVQEKEKRFFSLRERADDNPFNWEFDLCCVTLGNFRYRKMTLVRDYAELLEGGGTNAAFDTVFSLAPRQLPTEQVPVIPPEASFHVVSCDPTQSAAISLAQQGHSLIIQGPPGTGKSQTITNLIADYVARGKRVLFVCEKRAAIDVVRHRLEQRGLGDLCCLVHDSQTDKKEVIAELKQVYEAQLAAAEAPTGAWQRQRRQVIKLLQDELQPLASFHAAMTGTAPEAGVPLRALLDRVMQLRGQAPALTPLQKEALPGYALVAAAQGPLTRLADLLRELQADGVLAHHPLRHLAVAVAQAPRPLELLLTHSAKAVELLGRVREALTRSLVPETLWREFGELRNLLEFAARVRPVADWGLLGVLDPDTDVARRFAAAAARFQEAFAAVPAARAGAQNWTRRLPREDVDTALEQARFFERLTCAFLKPAWWRLRRVLNDSYNFRAHAVKPAWSQILSKLQAVYAAEEALTQAESALQREFGFEAPTASVVEAMQGWRRELAELSATRRQFLTHLLSLPAADGRHAVRLLAELCPVLTEVDGLLAAFLDRPAALPTADVVSVLAEVRGSAERLPEFIECLKVLAVLPAPLAQALRHLPLTVLQLEAAAAERSFDELCRADSRVNRFTGVVRRQHLQLLAALSGKWEDANAQAVRERAQQQFLQHVRLSGAPAAGLNPEQREFKRVYERGRKELEHELGKSMRFRSLRDLLGSPAGIVLRDLKPVWLMSPLSVSDTLPLDPELFDVVIFDEASQITLEEAVPAVFRAPQSIVVGDEMQLPPTNFFSAKRDGEGQGEWATEVDDLSAAEEEAECDYDLSANSFLAHAARNMPAQMLGWHYRSRSESLIGFSNWAFYQGRLLTVPEEELANAAAGRAAIAAAGPADGAANTAKLLDRPVSFHCLEQGLYQNRRNRQEADYIAQLVRGLLASGRGLTIGIVAFSEAQQDEIDGALERLAHEDPEFAAAYETEREREVDGQFAGLLVKNLENIQGDERDVIILSVCYGPGPDGRMLMNFGPINQSGGEKRLNVAFSRAKHYMAVVSSIRGPAIRNEYNDGANCLKNYLRYAEFVSGGDTEGARRVLREVAAGRQDEALAATAEADRDVFTGQLAAALRERGWLVDAGVGMSGFRCDLAVHRSGDRCYRLGILVDSPGYYRQTNLLERDLMKPLLLERFGWRVKPVLAKDWLRDPQELLAQLEALLANPEDLAIAAVAPVPEKLDLDALLARVQLEPEPTGVAEAAAVPADAASTPDTAAPDLVADGQPRHLIFTDDSSSKFWEVRLEATRVTVRFGRLGAAGQTQQKTFDTPESAACEARKLLGQKLAKGYRLG